MISSWTVLYAQTGSICYSSDELRKIADKMVKANTTIRLYKIAEQQLIQNKLALAAKDSAIFAKDSVIVNRESVISLKEEIIAGKDHEIGELRIANKKYARKNKLLKLSWTSSSIVLCGAFIYVLIN
jgi:hypothetical protein